MWNRNPVHGRLEQTWGVTVHHHDAERFFDGRYRLHRILPTIRDLLRRKRKAACGNFVEIHDRTALRPDTIMNKSKPYYSFA